MSAQDLQDFIFVSRYARYNPRLNRKETWAEAVDRVKHMHLGRYPHVSREIEWAFEQVRQKRVLGSMRALQFAGEPIEQRHAHLYNCAASYCDRLRFFQEAFWLLLCGCGVGFSVQKNHVSRLPGLRPDALLPRPRKTHVIADSPEGWADALGILLSGYFESPLFPEYASCEVEFKYHEISPAGSPLPWGLGKAPGPERLGDSLEKIRSLLTACLRREQTHLRPIDAYDLVMHFSGAVLAGGTRRSATICVFSSDDEGMLHAKTGNWLDHEPQRARSNNSCLLLRQSTTREQFEHVLQSVREFGEPGFIWTDSTEYLVNCCCEIGFWPVDERTAQSGWGLCALAEINGAKVRSRGDFALAARAAALIGTWQAGFTDLPYLGAATERIVRRDALLGVSITGMMENPDILLDPAMQTEMAHVIKDVNAEMAAKIGISPAARTTCIKPAGSSSCVLGTSSGIHPHHARRYFRRIRANKHETAVEEFMVRTPDAVQANVCSSNDDDVVLTFCIEAPLQALTKQDFRATTFLEVVRRTQQNWVLPGARPERCVAPWLTNNVSNTITVHDDEWDQVAAFLFDHRGDFTGVALLGASGDKDYPQSPMCDVPTDEEIVTRYGDVVSLASPLVEEALHAFGGDLWSACEALLHPDKARRQQRREAWVRRASAVAGRHFGHGLKLLCSCLQDVYHQRLWTDLADDYEKSVVATAP